MDLAAISNIHSPCCSGLTECSTSCLVLCKSCTLTNIDLFCWKGFLLWLESVQIWKVRPCVNPVTSPTCLRTAILKPAVVILALWGQKWPSSVKGIKLGRMYWKKKHTVVTIANHTVLHSRSLKTIDWPHEVISKLFTEVINRVRSRVIFS